MIIQQGCADVHCQDLTPILMIHHQHLPIGTQSPAGILYVVATPIGNLNDITLRALETLRSVDAIACEDTRQSKKLLNHFNISKELLLLHDFNESRAAETILARLKEGQNIALISDAGTPLISDPGYKLVSLLSKEKIKVIPIPGPSAFVTALSAAGLSSDRFLFLGFLPAKEAARHKMLEEIKNETATLIFYEAPHRIVATIDSLVHVLGAEREAVVAKELTKIHEKFYRGGLNEIKNQMVGDSDVKKGEYVILVAGAEEVKKDVLEAKKILSILLKELPTKKAAKLASEITKMTSNELYEIAIKEL